VNPWDDAGWNPERLAQSYWLVIDSAANEADLPNDDPRVLTVLLALFSGMGVMEGILDRRPDPEELVWLIDSLPDSFLRYLAFERVWDEQRRRLDVDYWEALP
jgi:hypothetical protein